MQKILFWMLLLFTQRALSQTQPVLAELRFPNRSSYTIESKENIVGDNPGLNRFIKNYLTYHKDKYVYISCNENNQFYDADTVRMQRISKNYYPVWSCCKFVEWRLVNDAEFLWSDLQTCEEEAQRSYYLSVTEMTASQKKGSIYLSIVRNGVTIDRFKVLGIEEVASRHRQHPDKVLVLLRQRLKQ